MRTIVITGASDGIGAAAARQLADSGDRLILVGRSPEKTQAVASDIGAEHHVADYTRLDDVRALADALTASCDRIDVLANNAGGMFDGPTATVDGFEKAYQVNYLAPFLLTNLLREVLLDSGASVVNTSSLAAKMMARPDRDDPQSWKHFTQSRAYGNAKLGNVLFSRALHDRFHARGLSSVAFHPGVVATNFAHSSGNTFQWAYTGVVRRLFITPEQGGARLRHFIQGRPGTDWESGRFYMAPGKVGNAGHGSNDPVVLTRTWQQTSGMLGVNW